jgi:uncharacterized membrane protein
MATLAVWKFDTPSGADESAMIVEALDHQDILALRDAATVSWTGTLNKPRTRQLPGNTPQGTLNSSFWGLLFGMIFYVPLLGAATGAAGGALAGSLTDVGIDDTFINQVRDQVTPGTSALFVLGPDAVLITIESALAMHQPVARILTRLSAAQDAALRSVFAEESAPTS